MKTLTAHRLSIQFDVPDKRRRRPATHLSARLEAFTDTLQRAFPKEMPALTTDSEDFNAANDITID